MAEVIQNNINEQPGNTNGSVNSDINDNGSVTGTTSETLGQNTSDGTQNNVDSSESGNNGGVVFPGGKPDPGPVTGNTNPEPVVVRAYNQILDYSDIQDIVTKKIDNIPDEIFNELGDKNECPNISQLDSLFETISNAVCTPVENSTYYDYVGYDKTRIYFNDQNIQNKLINVGNFDLTVIKHIDESIEAPEYFNTVNIKINDVTNIPTDNTKFTIKNNFESHTVHFTIKTYNEDDEYIGSISVYGKTSDLYEFIKITNVTTTNTNDDWFSFNNLSLLKFTDSDPNNNKLSLTFNKNYPNKISIDFEFAIPNLTIEKNKGETIDNIEFSYTYNVNDETSNHDVPVISGNTHTTLVQKTTAVSEGQQLSLVLTPHPNIIRYDNTNLTIIALAHSESLTQEIVSFVLNLTYTDPDSGSSVGHNITLGYNDWSIYNNGDGLYKATRNIPNMPCLTVFELKQNYDEVEGQDWKDATILSIGGIDAIQKKGIPLITDADNVLESTKTGIENNSVLVVNLGEFKTSASTNNNTSNSIHYSISITVNNKLTDENGNDVYLSDILKDHFWYSTDDTTYVNNVNITNNGGCYVNIFTQKKSIYYKIDKTDYTEATQPKQLISNNQSLVDDSVILSKIGTLPVYSFGIIVQINNESLSYDKNAQWYIKSIGINDNTVPIVNKEESITLTGVTNLYWKSMKNAYKVQCNSISNVTLTLKYGDDNDTISETVEYNNQNYITFKFGKE